MRKPTAFSLSRPTLLCSVLALAASCERTRPRAAPPSNGTAVAQDTRPASTPDASTPEPATAGQAASPWQRARVGDRVTYTFSVHRTTKRDTHGTAAAGVVTLEVVAVEAPWVWLNVSFASDGGTPLAQPPLARSLVLPVRMDATQPLEVPREGVESAAQPTVAGRTWEAKRYLRDERLVDGPLENRLYAVDPGPLYLTNGLLEASTTMAGFGSNGSSRLTLVEARQGGASAGAGTRPGLERPMGPGTWTEARQTAGGVTSVQRFCESAERGHVLFKNFTGPGGGGEPCPDFAGSRVVPLEEAVLNLLWNALETPRWPPHQPKAAPAVRETVTVGEHQVPALRFDTPKTLEGARAVQVRTYAADPWDAALAGLAYESRFLPLADTLYSTSQPGKREAVESLALVGWGNWVVGGKP